MRVAEFTWTAPPPTLIDEQLVLYDDGVAWLVLREPRGGSPKIGSYACTPEARDFDLLRAAGPERHVIDVLAHQQPLEALFEPLGRVCDLALETPQAVAAFHGRPVGAPTGGRIEIALIAIAEGNRPVEFELDPARCAVHFFEQDAVLAWREFPELQVGFITPDAEGLGGLRRTAILAPAAYGVISIALDLPEGADGISLQVAGWLESALPDDAAPSPFEIRTQLTRLVP